MGEVLKFVTLDVGLRKKRKKKTEKRLRTEVSKKKKNAKNFLRFLQK